MQLRFSKTKAMHDETNSIRNSKWLHSAPQQENYNMMFYFAVSALFAEGLTPACDRIHDDVIKWKHFPRYWSFVWGIYRSPVNSPHKGQWRGAFSSTCAWIKGWVNNREAGDLGRHRTRYDVTVIFLRAQWWHWLSIIYLPELEG